MGVLLFGAVGLFGAVDGLLGNKVYGLLGNKVYGLLGDKICGLLGNKMCGLLGDKICGLLGNKEYGLLGDKICGLLDDKVYGLLGNKVLITYLFRLSEFEVIITWNSLVCCNETDNRFVLTPNMHNLVQWCGYVLRISLVGPSPTYLNRF